MMEMVKEYFKALAKILGVFLLIMLATGVVMIPGMLTGYAIVYFIGLTNPVDINLTIMVTALLWLVACLLAFAEVEYKNRLKKSTKNNKK